MYINNYHSCIIILDPPFSRMREYQVERKYEKLAEALTGWPGADWSWPLISFRERPLVEGVATHNQSRLGGSISFLDDGRWTLFFLSTNWTSPSKRFRSFSFLLFPFIFDICSTTVLHRKGSVTCKILLRPTTCTSLLRTLRNHQSELNATQDPTLWT